MIINRYVRNHPIDIISCQLGIPLSYKQECIDEIIKLGDSQNNTTHVKASMSHWRIWNESNVFNKLLDNILDFINKNYPNQENKYKYEFKEVWGATYKKGDYSNKHHHLPARTSFVYYLKETRNATPLIFPKKDLQIFPKDDLLVVFPSNIFHKVPPKLDDDLRICLAGNLDYITETFPHPVKVK